MLHSICVISLDMLIYRCSQVEAPHIYMNMLLKNNYAFEQGMKGERGDSGRPGVHVSLHVCVCVIYI